MPSALFDADRDAKIQSMLTRIKQLNDFIRRKNRWITGLPENPRENSEQTHAKVQELLTDELQLGNAVVKVAYRVQKALGCTETSSHHCKTSFYR